MAKIDIRLKPGERGLLVGQTGSGKSYAAAWMLRHAGQRVIIMDTKEEPLFERIPKPSESYEIVGSVEDMITAWKRRGKDSPEYIIVRPSADELAKPEKVDEYLYQIHVNCRDVFTFIDEAYQFHSGTTAGKGLISLLTRGRARAQTTLIATQRPAWLSRFALTEAQKFYLFRLTDINDWKRLSEVIPGIRDGIKMADYQFLYYVQGREKPYLMEALDPIADLSYTPQISDGNARRWI